MFKIKTFLAPGLALALLLSLGVGTASADPTLVGVGSNGSFTGSGTDPANGAALSASATFSLVGTDLQIVLTNTSTFSGSYVPSNILTALVFDQGSSNNGVTLSPTSATANVLIQGPLPSGTTIGDFYDYKSGISSSVWPGATQGISTAGFNIFGQGNFGSNGQNVDGFGEGIVGPGYTTGNDHIPTTPLVQNSMTFLLTPSATFDVDNVTHVFFQYGTALEGQVVPEPSTLAIAGLGALGFLTYGLKRRKKS